MSGPHKLLGKAPDALDKALASLTAKVEDAVPEGRDLSTHVLMPLNKNEVKLVREYLDSVLKEKKIEDSDLKTLFEQRVKAWGINGPDARAFFEGLRDSAREKLNGR